MHNNNLTSAHEKIRHDVTHNGHYLTPQGPIETFIHHNTLHAFEQYSFYEAVQRAKVVTGGEGYLPNESYREFFRNGRITESDISSHIKSVAEKLKFPKSFDIGNNTVSLETIIRHHLISGIDSIVPEQLSYEVDNCNVTLKFREDLSADARNDMIKKSREFLKKSVDRIGKDWTFSDWFVAHSDTDLVHYLVNEVTSIIGDDQLNNGVNHSIESLMQRINVPEKLTANYLSCIDTHFKSHQLNVGTDIIHALWLQNEVNLLEKLMPLHFGIKPSVIDLAKKLDGDINTIETYASRMLWISCIKSYGVLNPYSPTDPATLAEYEHAYSSSGFSIDDNLDDHSIKAKSKDYTNAIATAEIAKIGCHTTHTDFLSILTGDDINGAVNRYMIQILGGFLDEGLAAWHMPTRDLGLYNSWRMIAPFDKSFDLYDINDWKEKISNLPEQPEQAIENAFNQLGIERSAWDSTICQLLQKLPGWSGMVAWREVKPDSLRNSVQHADLVELLAIRITVETLVAQQCCMENWGINASIESIQDYFSVNSSELYVREMLELGKLPESMAQSTHELLNFSVKNSNNQLERWEIIAQTTWLYNNSAVINISGDVINKDVWRLFNLAQCLGLASSDIHCLNKNTRDQLLSVIDMFPSTDHGAVWLQAYEGNYRDKITNALRVNYGKGRWATRDSRPQAQVVFCIDEREEAIRRHLEEINPKIETLGAAGFFGLPMQYKALHDHGQTPLCPVAVIPDREINEVNISDDKDIAPAFIKSNVTNSYGEVLSSTQEKVDILNSQGVEKMAKANDHRNKWSEYIHNIYWEAKRNLVSSYFLLDILGLPIIIQLYMSIFAPNKTHKISEKIHNKFVPSAITKLNLDTVDSETIEASNNHNLDNVGFPLEQQADIVFNFLSTIGLTRQFARLVVLCGHGSSSLNNPHESAHDCGACGGKHGGPNARAFSDLANRPAIRKILRERGMNIPDDTWFLGSQHNTCHEGMSYYDVENVPDSHHDELSRLLANVDDARAFSAQERCRRFDSAPKDVSPEKSLHHIESRAIDISQVRPEWGHATNSFAVVGRRSLTQGLFLDRRPFLISYNPQDDLSGDILERILLAVGPVGAGINLEYYFSTVDNKRYGCDTKIPHNVSGLIGVMEGVMSDLRTGLPLQMVEVHEPMRLQLVVEANPEVLGKIYGRQPLVQTLLNNEWIHLIVANPDTGELVMFDPNQLTFVACDKPLKQLQEKDNSWDCYRGLTDFIDPLTIVKNTA